LKFGTQDDLLPYNDHTYFPGISQDPNDPDAAFAIANDAHLVADHELFMGGDVRANENIELTAVHTLFLREHNRVAVLIHNAFPALGDEAVYQTARAIVIAEVQSITFNEFLPALLGPNVITTYSGYNSRVNPGIATEFSTAGFRVGHSLLAPDVEFLNPDGTTKFEEVSLAESFFNPPLVQQNGADPILKYLATDNAQEVDNKIVPELQNFLFGPPGAGGFDLASLNIQRGRDHGLADYNTTRAAYGLPKVTSFADITSNKALQAQLRKLYNNDVNNIDLWVGGLAEDHVAGGSVGPLFQRIIATQFQHTRDGDRLWFENQFSGIPLSILENTTLAQIIGRNTVNNDLQSNVFFFKMQISGTVFNDANSNGVRDRGEGGVSGRVIQVLDPTGAVIAQTKTGADGTYSFDNLRFSLEPAVAYQVREVLPSGVFQTTSDPPTLTFTRGRTFSGINFGNSSRPRLTASLKSSSASSSGLTDSGATLGDLDSSTIGEFVNELNPTV
jgi:peroxidase